ncbi:hypothetical protein E9531_02465 [Lampropedia puyangensis]|uniref:Peptidase M48 domain-containing protein n=1 Tax=Lampropedia puyangensis TaxID=1330072 RepID=A0A4S8FD17_9BURK|nr:M48 family metallopeptidase [Lampropedia puyangensis]THU05420.1 hypothetical protein E9531_02465 [Lampropedia puyangensis]
MPLPLLPPSLTPAQQRWLAGAILLAPAVLMLWSGAWLSWSNSSLGINQHWTMALPYRLTSLAFILACIGLIGGMTALACTHMLGIRAQQSAEQLMRLFSKGQACLPWVLLLLWFCFFGSAISQLSAETIRALHRAANSAWHYKTALGLLLGLLIIIGVAALQLLRWRHTFAQTVNSTPDRQDGELIDPSQAPKLWGFVQQVANKTHTPPPEYIVAGVMPHFFVTDSALLLPDETCIAEGKRTLYLCLPLMQYLSGKEFAGLLAHELAHFAANDTAQGRAFSTTYAMAHARLSSVRDGQRELGYLHWLNKPSHAIAGYFLHSFDIAFYSHKRQQELRADQVEVALVGASTFATTSLRLTELSPVLSNVLDDAWQQSPHQTSQSILAEFDKQVRLHAFADPRSHLQERQAGKFDSHPTSYQRFKAAGVRWSQAIVERYQQRHSSRLLQAFGLAHASASHPTQPISEPSSTTPLTVVDKLQLQFSDAAKDNATLLPERVAELREWAQEGTQATDLEEKILLPVAATGVLAIGMLFILSQSQRNPIWEQGLYVLALLACVAAIGVLILRAQRPVMHLTRTGISVGWPGQEELIAWHEIAEINIESGFSLQDWYSTMCIQLVLAEHAHEPQWRNGLRTRYDRAHHQVVISVQGIADHDAQEVSDLLHTYWYGGVARDVLRRSGH